MLNSVPPPTYVRAVGFQGRIDRAQVFEFIAPASIVQLSAADEAGAYKDGDVSDSKLQFRLFHGLTPETETSCFYFWSTANGFRPNDPAATEQLFREIGAAFQEDLTVVEGQQARLSELGEDSWSISRTMPRGCTCGAPWSGCYPTIRRRWPQSRRRP